jgi:hypothetical protein
VVHAAADFEADAATVERTLLQALLFRLGGAGGRKTLL